MKYFNNVKTVNAAAHEWVREFNAIDQGIINVLVRSDPDSWHEVTEPTEGDRVYVIGECGSGEIVRITGAECQCLVLMDDDEEVTVPISEVEVERYDDLPIWGTMWSFGDSADDHWLAEDDGIRIMSQCGFRIFYHEEFGYFFGIDGAGYDFYESHWEPLYLARGLKWHEMAE